MCEELISRKRGRRMSYCTDCIHYKVCGNEGVDDSAMTFCADKQTDGDLISRTELLNKIWQKEYGIDYDGVNLLNIRHIDIIEQLPSAEKTAEWIFRTSKSAKCSNCGHIQFTNGEDTTKKTLIHKALYHYCPNCGAKMKESEEEE